MNVKDRREMLREIKKYSDFTAMRILSSMKGLGHYEIVGLVEWDMVSWLKKEHERIYDEWVHHLEKILKIADKVRPYSVKNL